MVFFFKQRCLVSVPRSCDGQRRSAGQQTVPDEYVSCIHHLSVCPSINQLTAPPWPPFFQFSPMSQTIQRPASFSRSSRRSYWRVKTTRYHPPFYLFLYFPPQRLFSPLLEQEMGRSTEEDEDGDSGSDEASSSGSSSSSSAEEEEA